MDTKMIGNLPKNINEVVPTPKDNAHTICKVLNKSGTIVGYEFEDGKRVDKDEAVKLAKDGMINGVGVAVSKYGDEYLRTLPDGTESNNLSSLPQISV